MNYLILFCLIPLYANADALWKSNVVSPQYGGIVSSVILDLDHNVLGKNQEHSIVKFYAELVKKTGEYRNLYFVDTKGRLMDLNKFPDTIKGTFKTEGVGRGKEIIFRKNGKYLEGELKLNNCKGCHFVFEFVYENSSLHLEFDNLN